MINERQTVERLVMYQSINYLPDSLCGLIKLLEEKLNVIPEEFRKSANFNIYAEEDDYGYSSPEIKIKIYYFSPETEKEFLERIDRDSYHKKLQEGRELKLLGDLKKKYEPDC